MKTRIDLNPHFDYPDDPEQTEDIKKLIVVSITMGLGAIGSVTMAILFSEQIDNFFTTLLKAIIL